MVLNADETGWKHFNSPECDVEFVENTANSNNEYYGNIEIELSGARTREAPASTDGRDIGWYRAETPEGTLTLRPATGTERENVIMNMDYEIGGDYHNGKVLFCVPDAFTLSTGAKVKIGDAVARNITQDEIDETVDKTVVIGGITEATGTTVTLTLEDQAIPTGLTEVSSPRGASSRNLDYTFKTYGDADWEGDAWYNSNENEATFTSVNLSICTDFSIKTGFDYLSLITGSATGVQLDYVTAGQTTAASITNAIESTDGSVQGYEIYKAEGFATVTVNGNEIMPEEATLTVVSVRGVKKDFSIFKAGGFLLMKSSGEKTRYYTFSDAIAALSTGENGVIECDKSEITESEIIIDSNKEITIRPSGNLTTFTMNGGETHRVLTISANASVTLKSVVIKKGATLSDGGGIYFTGKNLYLENCSVENNYSGLNGGGIYFGGGKLTLLNTDIKYNRCGRNGGGIYMTCLTGMADLHFDSGGVFDNNAFMGKGGGIFRYAGYIYTGYGCWNGPPNEMWGEYNIFFSVGIDGRYHEYELTYPAKLYNNYANEGSQLYI